MNCINATSLFLQISNTINDADTIIALSSSSTNESYLARYLTVFIAGIYEKSIEEIVWEFASKSGLPEIENFVANQVNKTFRNPDMGNIISLIRQFSSAWANQLNQLDDIHKNAINSIITNKNNIAHGDPSLITFSDIKNYHRDASKVIEEIDRMLLST